MGLFAIAVSGHLVYTTVGSCISVHELRSTYNAKALDMVISSQRKNVGCAVKFTRS